MTDETNETVDGEPFISSAGDDSAEAESSDVPAAADVSGVLGSIPGATPAETPDDEPAEEVSAETPTEKYARLVGEGIKPSRLIVISDSTGAPVDVRVQ